MAYGMLDPWNMWGMPQLPGMPGMPQPTPDQQNSAKWANGFGLLSDIGLGMYNAGQHGRGLGAAGAGITQGVELNQQRALTQQDRQVKNALMQGQFADMYQKQQQRQALQGWLNTPEGKQMMGNLGVPPALLASMPFEQIAPLVMEGMKQQRFAGAYPPMSEGGGPPASGAPASAPSGGGFNFGNIRSAQGGFTSYPSGEEAVAAVIRNAQAYPAAFNGGQPMTLMQIGARWAPKGDGANDPIAWASNVGKVSGLPVDQPIDLSNPEIAARFARGVHAAEFGQQALADPEVYRRGATSVANPSIIRAQYTPQTQGGQPQGQPQGQPSQPVDYASDPAYRGYVQAYNQAVRLGDKAGAQQALLKMNERRGQIQDKEIERRRLAIEEANKPVLPGGQLNRPYIGAQTEIARAGAAPAAETEALKRNAEDAAKIASEAQAAAAQSRVAKANLQQLGGLLEGMNTGKFKETTIEIKRIAKGLGIDLTAAGITDDVGQAQAAKALVGQMALQMRNPSAGAGMPGAMSDKDREFLTSMIPSLETSPEGIKLMLSYMGRLHDQNIALAKVATEYRRSPQWAADPQGIVAALQDYAEKHPIFSQADLDAAMKASQAPKPDTGGQFKNNLTLPTISNPADAAKLPRGTKFRDPQGNIRQVP